MSRILFITEVNKPMLLSGGYLSFGPMWLSAALKRDGHTCEISNVEYEAAEKVCREFKPDIVAYRIWTGGHVKYAELNRQLKKQFKFYAMFGGPHISLVPDFIEEDGVDAICISEGIEAVPEFINKLDKGEDITNVKNFWVKMDNKIYKNPPRPLLKNLDLMPFPDRSLYDKYELYRLSKVATVLASIGCPFTCTYCFNSSLTKVLQKGDPLHRRRSVDNVIEEIKEIKKNYPQIEYIVFRDEIFNIQEEWVEEFSEKYPVEVGLPFFCQVRIDTVTEKTADYLKKAGVYFVGAGIESGNDKLRNEILKRTISKEQTIKGFKLLRDRKIKFLTFNLIAVPGETIDTAFETLDLNIKCRPTYADSCILTPYPKTEIYDYAVAHGYLDPNIEYPSSFRGTSLLKLKDKKKLENLQQLFGITVGFPFLRPFLKLLVRLPNNSLYTIIRKFWKGYCYRYRIYPPQVRVSFRQSAESIYEWLFIHQA